jgi:PAS domain-containing protein
MSDLADIAERRRRRHPRSVLFCSSCGDLVERSAQLRVCPGCGMGVLLSTAPEALPARGAAFVVVDRDLRVTAVSGAGERLFGSDPSGRLLPSLISVRGADAELVRQVARAASGLSGTEKLTVRIAGKRGAFEARISPCGPPRAALVAVTRPTA